MKQIFFGHSCIVMSTPYDLLIQTPVPMSTSNLITWHTFSLLTSHYSAEHLA